MRHENRERDSFWRISDNLPQKWTLGILRYVNNVAVLGEGDTCCLLLQYHGVNILVDCSAAPQLQLTGTGPTEQQPAGHTSQQQPDVLATDSYAIHLRVPDIASCVRTQDLDAVLVTSPYALLGLPHLQQQLQQQGKQLPLHVYCTEPVYHTFQHVATELLSTQQLLQQISVQPQQQEQALQQVPPSQLKLLQQQMQQHVYQLQQQLGTPPPAASWPGQQQQQQQVAAPSNLSAPVTIRPPMPPPGLPPAPSATATAQRAIPGPRPPPMPPVQGVMAVQQGLAAMRAASGAIQRHVPPPVPPPMPPPPAAAAALGYTSTMPGAVPPHPVVMPAAAAAAAAAAAGAQGVPLSAHMPPPAAVPCNAAVAVSAGIPPPRPPPTPPCAPLVAAAAAAAAPLEPHPAPPALPPPAPPSGPTVLPPALTATGPLTAAGALLRPMMPYGNPTAASLAVPAAAVAAPSGIPPPAPPVAPRESSAATVPRAAAAAAAAGAAAQAKPQIPPPAPPLEPPPAAAAAAAADGGRPLDQAADQHPPAGKAAAAAAAAATTGVLVPLFTLDQLQSVLDRLQIVRFGERVVLPGCWGVTAEARPSGSSAIGTAMWVITAGSQSIAYLSPASLYPNHSAPLHKPSLLNLSALIISPGSLCPDLPSLPPGPLLQAGRQELAFNAAECMLRMAAAAAATAVRAGGRVLVPVLPSGGLLQLLEHIPAALEQLVPNSTHVPLLYLSAVAADALALANSCCEYLETKRRDLVLSAGQPPFEFEKLVTSGRLKIVMGNPGLDVGGAVNPSVAAAAADDQRQQQQQWVAAVDEVVAAGPCVVFVSLWSMAAGPGAMLADLWSSNPSNLLLLTEQGPLSADWIQGCRQIWQQQQQRWQILYCPINSLAGCPDPKVAAAASASASFGGKADPASRSAAPLAGNSGVAGACRTAVEGCLTAGQLARLLDLQETAASSGSGGSSVQSLLLGAWDRQLLEQALGSSRSQLDGCRITTLLSNTTVPAAGPACSSSSSGGDSPSSSNNRLSFQLVDLPDALLQVSLSKDLAKSLLLIPAPTAAAAAAALPSHEGDSTSDLTVPQVSVARVRGLLCYKSGVWQLEPLPGGTKPGAVAAAVDEQQQQAEMLMWGRVDVTKLLGDLQAAGFDNMYISTESVTLENGSAVPATVIKLPDVEAEIRLSAHESEVICDAWHMRKQLTDALMKQLHVL